MESPFASLCESTISRNELPKDPLLAPLREYVYKPAYRKRIRVLCLKVACGEVESEPLAAAALREDGRGECYHLYAANLSGSSRSYSFLTTE
jgi:hypothetical protein